MIQPLSLFAKNDIPFQEAQLILRQPSIVEIGYIGEKQFFRGCEYLAFSKDSLSVQDKNRLQEFSNFEILMTIMKNTNKATTTQIKQSIKAVFNLILPEYKIDFLPMTIRIFKDGQQHLIDKQNFQIFRQIISQMFCLQVLRGESKAFNPAGKHALYIAKKIEEGRKKRAKIKGQGKQGASLLGRYISILAVGQHKDINQLMQYSIYQLFDEFHRFKMKNDFDINVNIKLAGGKGSDEIINWMDNIHFIK